MAVKTELTCDGCGEVVLLSPGEHTDQIALGYTVSLNGAPDIKYDLCPGCVGNLQKQADPTTWPKRVR